VQEWPVHGGEWGTAHCNYPEIIVTGFVVYTIITIIVIITSIFIAIVTN